VVVQLLVNLSEEFVAILEPFLKKAQLTDGAELTDKSAADMGTLVMEYLMKEGNSLADSRSVSNIIEKNFKEYYHKVQSSHTHSHRLPLDSQPATGQPQPQPQTQPQVAPGMFQFYYGTP
jgi:hypothetical protein